MPGRAYVDYNDLAAGQFAVTNTWIEPLILFSCLSRDSKPAARVLCPIAFAGAAPHGGLALGQWPVLNADSKDDVAGPEKASHCCNPSRHKEKEKMKKNIEAKKRYVFTASHGDQGYCKLHP